MMNPVLERLQRYALRPRKELGQHFLVEPHTLAQLADTIDAGPGDTVLEFGAGVGVLTEELLKRGARVVAVELDDALADLLQQELGAHAGFRLVRGDLTRVSARALCVELGIARLKLAGNLPYQLTSHVLFSVLDLEEGLADATFMVQREVAERIVSPPGSRDYGILSVLLHAYHDVELVMRVKAGAFVPPPRVESAVLRIVPRRQGPALAWSERPALIRLVKSTFNERRKVLRNTLKKFYELDSAGLGELEAASRLDLGRRPETLAVGEFVQLLRALPEVTPQANREARQ